MGNITTNTAIDYAKLQKPAEDYTLFLVFELPNANDVASHNGKLIIEPARFLLQCLENAKRRNDKNLKEGLQHSNDYFTDLNHAQRHRIPSTLQRLNQVLDPHRYAIISFSVYKDEQVKNKVYNQRVSSVNPLVIELERIKSIYYPLNYQTERFVDLYPLGDAQIIDSENFCIINVSDAIVEKARQFINV